MGEAKVVFTGTTAEVRSRTRARVSTLASLARKVGPYQLQGKDVHA